MIDKAMVMQLKQVFEWYPSFMYPIFIRCYVGWMTLVSWFFLVFVVNNLKTKGAFYKQESQSSDKINGLLTRSRLARQINICYGKSTSNHLDI